MINLPIEPAFKKDNLAITMQTSEFFAPYASVTLLSIIEHTTSEHNYDIIIMTWDMQEETAKKLSDMAADRENVSVRVVDVSKEIEPYKKLAEKRPDFERFSAAGLTRLLFLDLLPNYDKILNFDCDMLVCADVAELFEYDLSDYYMGGVEDLIVTVQNKWKHPDFSDDFLFKTLKLDSTRDYLNGGLSILNLSKIRSDFSQSEILDYAKITGQIFKYWEQDTFNGLFKKKFKLPMEWNWFVDSKRIISVGFKKFASIDDSFLRYYEAEKKVKNYHFLTTEKKAWQDSTIAYAHKWWDCAQKSPFINEILNTQSGENNLKKDILFYCDSVYQLINIINIKQNYYHDIPCDLLLCQSTNLIKYKEKIEQANLFENIIVSNFNTNTDYSEICKLPIKQRTLQPERYEHIVRLQAKYTDFFVSVWEYPYIEMLYYTLVNAGKIPKVHVFEDGGSTYSDNFSPVSIRKIIDHMLYPINKRIASNTKDVFMYRPEFYCGKSKLPKIPIPKLTLENKEVVRILSDIFGTFELPKEKYLFFNEAFMADDKVSYEIQILDKISETVGKENITVKMHPRSTLEKEIFQIHGYKIFSDNSVPWELVALAAGLQDKVLLSIASNSIWTPFVISGKNTNVVSLLNVMKLPNRPAARTKEFHALIQKVKNEANKESAAFFMPNNFLEMTNILRYIEGEK